VGHTATHTGTRIKIPVKTLECPQHKYRNTKRDVHSVSGAAQSSLAASDHPETASQHKYRLSPGNVVYVCVYV